MILFRAVDLFLIEQIPTTAESYRLPLEEFIGQIGAERDLDAITQADIKNFKGHLQRRLNKRTHEPLAPMTRYKYFKTVKIFLKDCVRLGYISASPANLIPNFSRPKPDTLEKAMPEEDIEVLTKYLIRQAYLGDRPGAWRNLAMFLFFHDSGCRRGGVSTLTIDRLFLDKKSAYVHEKGGAKYPVYFEDLCQKAIAEWLARRKVGGKWVFSATGRQWKEGDVTQQMRRLCTAAGITPRGPHSIRHYKGLRLAEAEVSATIAKEIFGHSDIDTTVRHYYKHSKSAVEKTARKFAMQGPGDTPENVILFPKISGK